MKIIPIKTKAFIPPKDSLLQTLLNIDINDGDIICITSKILAIHQGRSIKISDIEKKVLVQKEADKILSVINHNNKDIYLTIKNNIVIASAGIDESNSNGYYVLWPEKVDELLRELHIKISELKNIKKFGLISTDSATYPLRAGVRGISTGSYGFNPLKNYIGKKDIFNRELLMTRVNISDSIAAAAVFIMGEGNEMTPISIVRGVENIEFGDFNSETTTITPSDDLFKAFFKYY